MKAHVCGEATLSTSVRARSTTTSSDVCDRRAPGATDTFSICESCTKLYLTCTFNNALNNHPDEEAEQIFMQVSAVWKRSDEAAIDPRAAALRVLFI